MPQLKVRIGCVVLAVIMSAVTYYLVEPGLRWGRYGGYKAAGLLSVMVIVGIAGYSVTRHDGYTARMNDPEQTVIDTISNRLPAEYQRCLSIFHDWQQLSDGMQCRFEQAPEENTIALIGDSHAGQLYPGLAALKMENESLALIPASCAVPLIGLHSQASPELVKIIPTRANTEHLLSEGFSYILSHKNIKKVILAHHPECSLQYLSDTLNPDNHNFESILHDGFIRTYEALLKAGKEVYVIEDNPQFSNENWAKCKAAAVRRPIYIPVLSSLSKNSCLMNQENRSDRQIAYTWNKIARETSLGYSNIHFIDLEKALCPNGICSMLDNKGSFLYADTQHLNEKGSIYVAPFIIEVLKDK